MPAASHADASAVGDGEGGSSSELSLGRRKRLTAAHALLRALLRSVDQSGWLDVKLAREKAPKRQRRDRASLSSCHPVGSSATTAPRR